MKKQLIGLCAMAFVLVGGPAAAADWSSMTGGLDLSGEITGVIAIVGLLAGFFIVKKGGSLLLSMIR